MRLRKTHRLTREMPIQTIRRRVGQKVRRMTKEQARSWLADYAKHWREHMSVVCPLVKELTGGFNSQSLNSYVVRKVYDRSK